jgi:uncharacterized protein YsxB (DUF464 family)
MLNVTFGQKDNKLTLSLEGHTGYAETGKDIVCSACSILAVTVAQFVYEAEKSGYLKSSAVIKLHSGDTVVSCEPKDEMLIDIQNVYLFAQKGYELLAHNYPQHVELKQFDTE